MATLRIQPLKTNFAFDCLLVRRLQGAEFDSNYISTPQIEVSNIQWKYKGEEIQILDLERHIINKSC
jgi:hypothetical protein